MTNVIVFCFILVEAKKATQNRIAFHFYYRNGIRRVFFSLTKEDLNQIIKLNTDFIEEKYKELERFSLLPNVDELLKHKLQVFKKMLEEAYLEIAWQHRCTKGWLPRRKLKAAMEYLELYIKKSEQLLQKK